jgi:hypothetical protein
MGEKIRTSDIRFIKCNPSQIVLLLEGYASLFTHERRCLNSITIHISLFTFECVF